MFWGKTLDNISNLGLCIRVHVYNTRFVYCRELAPGIISLTGGWAHGDYSKQYGIFFHSFNMARYEPRHEKICILGLRTGQTQNGLYSHRSKLKTKLWY